MIIRMHIASYSWTKSNHTCSSLILRTSVANLSKSPCKQYTWLNLEKSVLMSHRNAQNYTNQIFISKEVIELSKYFTFGSGNLRCELQIATIVKLIQSYSFLILAINIWVGKCDIWTDFQNAVTYKTDANDVFYQCNYSGSTGITRMFTPKTIIYAQ